MGDEYPDTLSSSLQNRVRGFPAYFLGDIIPIGFIKPFETVSLSASEVPQGAYFLTETSRSAQGEKYPTPIYEFQINIVPEDLFGMAPDESGKVEKVYSVFIDYTWITDEPIVVTSGEYTVGGFEVPKSGNTLYYKIRVVNDIKFIPPDNEIGDFEFYATINSSIKFDVIPVFVGEEIPEGIGLIGPVVDEVRFSRGITKLLPSKGISLWLGFSGGVDLVPQFSQNSQSFLFGSGAFGLITEGLFGPSGSLSVNLAPAIYRDFIVKFGYSVVGSSQVVYDEEVLINFEDMFGYDEEENIFNKFINGGNYIILNKKLGSDEDFISKGFGVFANKFEFSDLEKRYIGKGVSDSGDPRNGISKVKFLEKNPIPFAVVKEKKISSTFTRQVKKYRQVNTSIPEEQIPNGSCNIQLYIPKSIISTSPGSFSPITLYATYQKVKKPNFRQVNSYNIRSGTTSIADLDAYSRNFYQSGSFAYDEFYVNPNLRYNFTSDIIGFENDNFDFNEFSNLQNLPPLFDEPNTPASFRTSIDAIGSKSYEDSSLVSKIKTYRISSRRIHRGSEDFPLIEGIFVAAANFRYRLPGNSESSVNEGGIGYIDYLGNFTLLISGKDILDKEWWNTYFGGVGDTIVVSTFLEDYNFRFVKYDRSVTVNSLFTDDEKIAYDVNLADALSVIKPMSEGGAGVGICSLDFLNIRNFNIKNEFAKFSKNPTTQSDVYYHDLSEAYFKNDVNPNWILNVVQILNPPVQLGGQSSFRGTITAESICLDLSPVELTRNGRIFYEGIGGIGASGGSNPYEQLWVRSNVYDIKLGFASDYYKMIGIYAHSFNNKIRSYNVNLADFFTFNLVRPYQFISSQELIDENTQNYSIDIGDPKWFGMPIDKLPFMQNGLDLIESEDVKSEYSSNENVLTYKILVKSKSKNEVKYIINKDNICLDLGENYRIFRIRLFIDAEKSSKLFPNNVNEDSSFWRYVISFEEPQRSLFLDNDVIAFADFNKINGDYKKGITSSISVPNYYAQKIFLKGRIIDEIIFNKDSFSEIEITVYDDDFYKEKSPVVSDCYPAIDGYTKGYVSMLNSIDSTPSIDFFVTGDHDKRWRLFRNVFQVFNNENVYQCVLKADQKSNIIYMMFSVNGCLLCKPIEGWTINSLYYHNQKVEAKNAFLIGSSSGLNVYALFPEAYNRIQNISINYKNSFSHHARIQPSYVVQANYLNNDFLMEEHNNTLACQAIYGTINSAKAQGLTVPSFSIFKGVVGGREIDVAVNLPEQVRESVSLLNPRVFLQNYIYNSNPDDRWSVNQPYTFEVLNNGSLIAFVLKDGFIHVFESLNGKDWNFKFGNSFLCGFRPVKWSNLDPDSYVDITNKKYYAGSCPPIDNISSCYDFTSGKLTLFYIINNAIFGQHFYADQISGTDSNSMFSELQTRNSAFASRSQPFYIVGDVPAEMIAAAKNKQSFVKFGVINSSNVSSQAESEKIQQYLSLNRYLELSSNISTNGKAPGACYIGAGVLRMYYEDENDIIKGATINENLIFLDVLSGGSSGS
jgi:hypothetical protein